jgi:putative acetyltransferase
MIEPARPDSPDAIALIDELEAVLAPGYPAESRHGYSVDKLVREGVAFFVARHDGAAAACGGVQLCDGYAEIKRMYVRPAFRGLGLARAMLDRLVAHARSPVVRLETGIHQHDAIRLYERYGFVSIGPFGTYRDDPLSRFYEYRS